MKAAVSLACETLCATLQVTVIFIFTAVRNSDLITFPQLLAVATTVR